jgi:hypothetical protein
MDPDQGDQLITDPPDPDPQYLEQRWEGFSKSLGKNLENQHSLDVLLCRWTYRVVVEVQAELNTLVEGHLRLPIRTDTHSSYNSYLETVTHTGLYVR